MNPYRNLSTVTGKPNVAEGGPDEEEDDGEESARLALLTP